MRTGGVWGELIAADRDYAKWSEENPFKSSDVSMQVKESAQPIQAQVVAGPDVVKTKNEESKTKNKVKAPVLLLSLKF